MLRTFLPLFALLLPAPALAQQAGDLTPAERAAVDRVVATNLASSGVPSASIAIVRDGRIVYAHAYGRQSDAIPVARADAPYQIASISKQFTAAALLLLEDDGRLRLDDPVSRYVPGITGGDRITIRQLLSHTSGLQDYWPQDYSFAAMATPITPQQIVDRWAHQPLDFEPGTQWQYSNTGYVVAGMIVERVAGMPLLRFLQERIFAPLQMYSIDQDLAVGPDFPTPYQRFALGPVRPERPAAHGWLFAAGELAMRASDLARWDIARMNRELLPADDWAEQERVVRLADGSSTNYGLGVTVGQNNGHAYVEHSGEAVGFLSENIVFPQDKVAVVVLVNADFSDAFTTIASQITRVVLPSVMTGAGEEAHTAHARQVFDQLRTGTLDRATMTEDSNFYFTPTALADYRQSLAALGAPTAFALTRPARLRGGFVNRVYRVTYPGRALSIVTYAEPHGAERYEQFLVMPAQ